MDASEIISSLLCQSAAAALHLDGSGNIRAIHNPQLLASWFDDPSAALPASTIDLTKVLQHLFVPQLAATLLQKLVAVHVDTGNEVHEFGTFPVRTSRHGALPQHLCLSAQRLASTADAGTLLMLRDVTAHHELQIAATRAQAAADTTMALLRGEPDAIRLFLNAAMASISALRATLRMSSRTSAALGDKLSRLQAGTRQLGQEAQTLHLNVVAQACDALSGKLATLQQNAAISGNDLLQVAPLMDRIAQAAGDAWRSEEQRYADPSPAVTTESVAERPRSRKQTNWPQASERRWSHFLRRRGEELGILAKLTIKGADAVPASIRRELDEILQHLLRNALEHGIETPEQRLAADKPAAGQISVTFEDSRAAGLRILIRDDGRGFDLERIGKAAVKCGLITEESLLERGAGDVVGFIFKPGFTTECLGDKDGHGRGMIFLRNAVTRLNGQVSVATKSGHYTQFNLQLPAAAPPETHPPVT